MTIEQIMALFSCLIGGLVTVVMLGGIGVLMFFVFRSLRPDPTTL